MTCPKCGAPVTSADQEIKREIVGSQGWSVPEPTGKRTYQPCGCVVQTQAARA